MNSPPTRRAVLAGLAGGGIAGCIAAPTGTSEDELPEDCPVTQGLDVEWPREFDAATVDSFVVQYENAYVREVVVEYEPKTMVDVYRLGSRVTRHPTPVDDGFEVVIDGGGAVYRPGLFLSAAVADPPQRADVVPVADVEDDVLEGLLTEAAEEGEAEHRVERRSEQVDRFIELVAALSGDFEPLSGPNDSDTAYFALDDTTVELTVRADGGHGDYGWRARYYVDEHVVWRVRGDEGDLREGELLECRG